MSLRRVLGEEITFDPPLVDLPPVGTEPDLPFVASISRGARERKRRIPTGMTYFTYGSALQLAVKSREV